MVASSTASKKAKSRILQQNIAADIVVKFGLANEDAVSRPMGSPGIDIMLSSLARSKFPFGIEAKRVEKLSIPQWWEQCEVNAKDEGLKPMLIYRRSREEAMVVMRWSDFLEVVKDEK